MIPNYQRRWRDLQVTAHEEPHWLLWANAILFLASIVGLLLLAKYYPIIPVEQIRWPAGWSF